MDDSNKLKVQNEKLKIDENADTNAADETVVDQLPVEEAAKSDPVNQQISESVDQPVTENTDIPTDRQTGETSESSENSENQVVMDDSVEQTPSEDKDMPESVQKKDENPNAKWYVVHTYSGHENKVAVTLKQRIESEHLEGKILDVLVPMQDKIEIKGGKKVNIKEKIFPGYILVKMVLDEKSWLAVRTTQGVTSFVGMGNKPTPISEAEVQTIVKFTQEEAPVYKQVFAADDTVKIVDGPFAEFIGKVDNVDEERGKVKVLVSIFGRETPVELDFLQVQKI